MLTIKVRRINLKDKYFDVQLIAEGGYEGREISEFFLKFETLFAVIFIVGVSDKGLVANEISYTIPSFGVMLCFFWIKKFIVHIVREHKSRIKI
jgi:hypothetical protein